MGELLIGDQVKTQLSEQRIFFPPKGPATASPEIGAFLNQYTGQQLLTGAQGPLGPVPMGMSAYTNAGSVWSPCGAPALSTPATATSAASGVAVDVAMRSAGRRLRSR